jgi:hypothetical protein
MCFSSFSQTPLNISVCVCVCVCGSGDGTQVPAHARQVLSLNCIPSPGMWNIFLIVAGRMSDKWEQDSNPGDWRKGRFLRLAGQHLDLSKNGTGPVPQGCRFLCLRMRKQASGKDKSRHGQLASLWDITTYHTTSRLQHNTLAHLWNLASQGEGAYLQIFPWLSLSSWSIF